MSTDRIRLLGFAVTVAGALQLGRPEMLQARTSEECLYSGNNHVICVYDLCSQGTNAQITACLSDIGMQFNPNCCADVGQCTPHTCDADTSDEVSCSYWTYSINEPCPFI